MIDDLTRNDYADDELYCLVCQELITDMEDVEVVDTENGAECICATCWENRPDHLRDDDGYGDEPW